MAEALGTELNFLTYKLSIKPRFTRNLIHSERFYKHFVEIKRQGTEINDEVVYQELSEILFPMLHELSSYLYRGEFKQTYIENHGEKAYETWINDYRIYRSVIRKLSEVLYGNADYWIHDYEDMYGEPYIAPIIGNPLEIPEENKDIEYLLQICEELPINSLKTLMTEESVVKAFKSSPKVTDIRDVYDIFKSVFYRWVRLGYKNDPDKQKVYFRLRKLAMDFCDIIYGDKEYWHKDYAECIGQIKI